MALRRTSDSLSRCDPSLYSNIYDARKRVDIKNHPFISTSEQDKLEISCEKLKQEELNHLKHAFKYTATQNSFIRIGKYLFLAVAFPPYLILYGLPKWILIEGISAICSIGFLMRKKIQQKAKQLFEKGIHKVERMVLFIQKIAHVLIQPVTRLLLECHQMMQRLKNQVFQFFINVKVRIQLAFFSSFNKLTEKFMEIQKKISRIKEPIFQQAKILLDLTQKGIAGIKQSFQVFCVWGRGQFQKVKENTISGRISLKQRLQISKQRAQKTAQWILDQFIKGKSSFKQSFAPIKRLYFQRMQPYLHRVKRGCHYLWQQTRDFFHQKHQKALVFLKQKQEKLKNVSQQQLTNFLFSSFWLPTLLKRWIQKWLSYPLVRLLVEKGIKRYSFVYLTILAGLSHLLIALSIGTNALAKLFKKIYEYVRLMNKMVENGLEATFRTLQTYTFYAFYTVILYIFIAAILITWAFQSLRNSMDLLISKFLLFIKSSQIHFKKS